MLLVQWLREAEDDLVEIVSFIADRDEIAAQRLKDAIEFAASRVPEHPYLYRLGVVPGTREIVVHPNYIVVYRIASTCVEIVNVVHARQEYP
ncbi:MAG: type II toxin-antitoxin system RelE/ParE family toxin [Burkholderiaceae bacterium]|nr:type II toxin-antitoxin system RelE/ParE family toxin [Burkholderiaceae bacterium]